MASVEAIWERIHGWLEQNAPEILERLRPGASAEQIQDLEEKLETELPEDFKASYLIHNGVADAQWFFCNQYFHSIDDILLDWSTTKAAMEEGNSNEYQKKDGDGPVKVQEKSWDKGWIAFGNNGNDHSMCIDMAPAEAGIAGQVFLWLHEGGHKWYAASFAEFLQNFADDLESGRYNVAEDGKSLDWKE